MSLTKLGICHCEGFYFNYKIDYCAGQQTVPTILIGGVLQDMLSWKNYVRELSKTNTVITVDLPGIGTGGVLPAVIGFDFLAKCVHAILVLENIQSVNIFSTSYSTIIAHEFARKFPHKVNKLVISSSMTEIPRQQSRVMFTCLDALVAGDRKSFADHFINGISCSEYEPANRPLVRRVLMKGISEMTEIQEQQFIANTERVMRYVNVNQDERRIPVRPLIFTGEYDTFTPPSLCEKIGSRYEDYDFTTIPGLDHFFHIGNNQLLFKMLVPYFNEEAVQNAKAISAIA